MARTLFPAILNKSKKVYKQTDTPKVIVSLTSFPARISDVWQVVECMLQQTHSPEKIILWLSKEQFPTAESIPLSLRDREGAVFEIRMVDGDIRSHKKYYYVSKEYPNSLIFLIDDDIYYPTDILEKSVKARETSPNAVICNYGYYIGYTKNGSLVPYNNWKFACNQECSHNLFFGSGGGTLFKPSELYKDLTNIELARKLTPIADDIWLNAMVRLAGKEIVMLKNGLILPIQIKDDIRLASQNMGADLNDKQLKVINEYYLKQLRHKVF